MTFLYFVWRQHVAGTTAWPLPVGEGRPDGSGARLETCVFEGE